jgi:hypothetical protein
MGTVYPGETSTARFRVRNTSASKATLTRFFVGGTGFSVTAGTALPVALDPQAAADFTVAFRAPQKGSYSATLESDGGSTLLLASVPLSLTMQVDPGQGPQAPGAQTVDFGNVERGASATRRFTLLNQQSSALPVPPISVQGADFSQTGAPSGVLLQPGQSAFFDVRFTPSATGPSAGTLTAGERSWTLAGTGIEPVLPKPSLAVSLAQAQSGQQGTITVKLDAVSRAAGTGTVTLDFRGPADAAVSFASGGRTASFSVARGDSQGRFAGGTSLGFQTGTTAGALVFTVELGGATSQQTVAIAGASPGLTTAKGLREAGGIRVQLTGFDNTRSAGALVYTFYDTAGNTVAPGAMRADATAGFAAYFAQPTAGGAFLLDALFPVTGDASKVAAFEVQVTNSAGTAKTARTSF